MFEIEVIITVLSNWSGSEFGILLSRPACIVVEALGVRLEADQTRDQELLVVLTEHSGVMGVDSRYCAHVNSCNHTSRATSRRRETIGYR